MEIVSNMEIREKDCEQWRLRDCIQFVNEAMEIPALILISSLSFLTICQVSFEIWSYLYNVVQDSCNIAEA